MMKACPSEAAETGGLEKTGGGGPIVQAPSERERERGGERERLSGVVWLCSAVHCGSALRCSGVAMVTSSRQSVLEVTECKSAYPYLYSNLHCQGD